MTRDAWCTPKWLAEAMGCFDLDPCSNERSHVMARTMFNADIGDGLHGAPRQAKIGESVYTFDPGVRTFVNPPYSRGQVPRWVTHWIETDFTFLLRWDPSTRWFRQLLEETAVVWFPHQRIDFDPPPGMVASSNPYPHALFMASAGPRIGALAQLGTFFIPQ